MYCNWFVLLYLLKFYIQNFSFHFLNKYLHPQANWLSLLTLPGLGRGRRLKVEHQEGSPFRPNVDIRLRFRLETKRTNKLCKEDGSTPTSRLKWRGFLLTPTLLKPPPSWLRSSKGGRNFPNRPCRSSIRFRPLQRYSTLQSLPRCRGDDWRMKVSNSPMRFLLRRVSFGSGSSSSILLGILLGCTLVSRFLDLPVLLASWGWKCSFLLRVEKTMSDCDLLI